MHPCGVCHVVLNGSGRGDAWRSMWIEVFYFRFFPVYYHFPGIFWTAYFVYVFGGDQHVVSDSFGIQLCLVSLFPLATDLGLNLHGFRSDLSELKLLERPSALCDGFHVSFFEIFAFCFC
jgi:hypothetical protein